MADFISEEINGEIVYFVISEINTTGVLSSREFAKSSTEVGLKAHSTSSKSDFKVLSELPSIREAIKKLITGFGSVFEQSKSEMNAKSIELELKIGFTAEAKIIVGVKTENSISLKIKWEN